MIRFALRVAIAAVLVGGGWVIGQAQELRTEPDFEISVAAANGRTEITCIRGCRLKTVQFGNNILRPDNVFFWPCGDAQRCESGRIGGWLTQPAR